MIIRIIATILYLVFIVPPRDSDFAFTDSDNNLYTQLSSNTLVNRLK